jgi:hypothetical protein
MRWCDTAGTRRACVEGSQTRHQRFEFYEVSGSWQGGGVLVSSVGYTALLEEMRARLSRTSPPRPSARTPSSRGANAEREAECAPIHPVPRADVSFALRAPTRIKCVRPLASDPHVARRGPLGVMCVGVQTFEAGGLGSLQLTRTR